FSVYTSLFILVELHASVEQITVERVRRPTSDACVGVSSGDDDPDAHAATRSPRHTAGGGPVRYEVRILDVDRFMRGRESEQDHQVHALRASHRGAAEHLCIHVAGARIRGRKKRGTGKTPT